MTEFTELWQQDSKAKVFADSASVACERCGSRTRVFGTGNSWKCDCGHRNQIDPHEIYRRRRVLFLAAEHERGYDPERLAYMLAAVTHDPLHPEKSVPNLDKDGIAAEPWSENAKPLPLLTRNKRLIKAACTLVMVLTWVLSLLVLTGVWR